MKCRVFYIGPQGRQESKEIVATKSDARAVFTHLYPGCKVEGVEVVRPARPKTTAVPSAPVEPEKRLDLRQHFAALKMHLGGRPSRASRTEAEQGNGVWFHRGKEARLHGEGRDKIDGRMTDANRAAFQAGWDEQERFMQPAATEEQRAKSAAMLRQLRQALGESI